MGADCFRENNCSALCVRRKEDARWDERKANVRSFARARTYISLNLFSLRKSLRFTVVRLFIVGKDRRPLISPARTRSEKGSRGTEIESLSNIKDEYRQSRGWLPAKLITSRLFDVSRGSLSFDRLHLLALFLSLFFHMSLKHAFPIDRLVEYTGSHYVWKMMVNSLEISVLILFFFLIFCVWT